MARGAVAGLRMPIQLQVALISALVSGCVAVLVVVLKGIYDTRARHAEWQQNRDEWMLEKEAHDVAEIIVALNSLVVRKGDLVRGITNELMNVSSMLSRDVTVEDAAEIEREVTCFFDDLYDKLADFHGEVSKWFYYKPQTLTVWLRDAAAVEADLKALEDNLLTLPEAGLFLSTYRHDATLEHYRSTVHENMELAENMEMTTDKALKEIAEFQRSLTRRLRDTRKVD